MKEREDAKAAAKERAAAVKKRKQEKQQKQKEQMAELRRLAAMQKELNKQQKDEEQMKTKQTALAAKSLKLRHQGKLSANTDDFCMRCGVDFDLYVDNLVETQLGRRMTARCDSHFIWQQCDHCDRYMCGLCCGGGAANVGMIHHETFCRMEKKAQLKAGRKRKR